MGGSREVESSRPAPGQRGETPSLLRIQHSPGTVGGTCLSSQATREPEGRRIAGTQEAEVAVSRDRATHSGSECGFHGPSLPCNGY